MKTLWNLSRSKIHLFWSAESANLDIVRLLLSILLSDGSEAEEADGPPGNPWLLCSLMKELGILGRKTLGKG